MRRNATKRRRAVLAATGFTTLGLAASVVAAGAVSGDPTVSAGGTAAGVALLQASGEPPGLLDYFTFIPQALLLLIAVGLRRYVLDEEDVPWWLDGDGLRARADALVPDYGQRLRERILERVSTTNGDTERGDEAATVPGTESDSASTSTPSTPATSAGATAASNGTTQSSAGQTTSQTKTGQSSATGASRSQSGRPQSAHSQSGGSQSDGAQSSDAQSSRQRSVRQGDRTSGPPPDRLTLGYGDQRIVVGDGKTVDEEIRAMLRAAGEGDHAKWIDDRHLHFVHDEHGFTLVVDGENPTRLNGERLRPGDRARVYPSDEIELSGVVTLSVERA